jgi:Arc/MetJ family transcription regulator
MTKRLVDIDDAALAAAQAQLGTVSMKDTVNEALRTVALSRQRQVRDALSRLGSQSVFRREDAWR